MTASTLMKLPGGVGCSQDRAQPEGFAFRIGQDQSPSIELGAGETYLLSTEVAGGFTGVFIEMHATGQGTHAYFDWFDYEPLESEPV